MREPQRNPELRQRLAQLEVENNRLRAALDMLRLDRAELNDWRRQEAGRCSRG